MSKPTRKQLSEIRAIHRRLCDMALGGQGSDYESTAFDPEPGEEAEQLVDILGLEDWCTWFAAVRRTWAASNGELPEPGRVCPIYFEVHSMHHFGGPIWATAVYLHEHGASAEPGTAP